MPTEFKSPWNIPAALSDEIADLMPPEPFEGDTNEAVHRMLHRDHAMVRGDEPGVGYIETPHEKHRVTVDQLASINCPRAQMAAVLLAAAHEEGPAGKRSQLRRRLRQRVPKIAIALLAVVVWGLAAVGAWQLIQLWL